jgi:hypothetical protein
LKSSILRLAASALLAASCGVETKPATEEVVVWQELASWTGRGPQQTESFLGETGALRLRWETRNETAPGRGRFQVTLHSAISGRPLIVAVDTKGIGRDTAYVTEDPRVFFLVVEAADIDWSVTVEEGIGMTASPTR